MSLVVHPISAIGLFRFSRSPDVNCPLHKNEPTLVACLRSLSVLLSRIRGISLNAEYYGQLSYTNSQTLNLRVSNPRTIVCFSFNLPFESEHLPGAGPIYPDGTLEHWPCSSWVELVMRRFASAPAICRARARSAHGFMYCFAGDVLQYGLKSP